MSDYRDAFIVLTPGQKSALQALDQARLEHDDEAARSIQYHLDAWDRHLSRPSTISMRDKRNAAIRRYASIIFENGGGI